MRKNGKKEDSLYAFLEASGLLERGTEREIAEAKRKYWNRKKREWKKEKLKNHKRFEIYLNPCELKLLRKNAIGGKVSITKYIKQVALHPRQGISDEVCGEVRQIIMQAHNTIAAQLEENNVPSEITDIALAQMHTCETEVFELLRPKL